MTGLLIGVDVGGTTTDVLVLDPDGTTVAQTTVQTAREPGIIVDGIVEAVTRALASIAADATEVATIGIGIPGAIDPATGAVTHAVNLGIGTEPLPLAATLESAFGRPVEVENDVRCAAVAAHAHLNATGTPVASVAYLGIGTGISAGLVLDGRLHRGRDGMAGEIGHVPVAIGAGPCACGLDGCLEVVASGRAIAQRWPTDDPAPARALFDAAGHDPAAAAVATDVVTHLATAVRWLVAATGVDAVVLGGGAGADDGVLARALRDALRDSAARSPLARQMFDPDRLHSLPSDLALGARGAARLAADRPSAPLA